ncbi:MAG: ATP-dependent DNA helicase RecG, partial [Bacteroidota bacterium]
IEFLKGVGPARAELLKQELRIRTFRDLLHFYPFRYVDRSRFYKVSEIQADMPHIQLRGRIGKIETVGTKSAKRLVAQFYDDTGVLELVWFKGVSWIRASLKEGVNCTVFGKPNFYKGKVNIAHPEVETGESRGSAWNATLQPVYSSSEKLTSRGLNSKGIGKLQHTLLENMGGHWAETLSPGLVQAHHLVSREEALRQIHFPATPEKLQRAQLRLKFEELFYLQLSILRSRLARQAKYKGVVFAQVGERFNRFYHEKLPFALTGAQKRVIKEIRKDLGSGVQMNRLLQGDVGSGKTIVSLMVMLIALDNGYQAALMAPTEILANQHFASISELLQDLGLKVALLTGSTKARARKVLHEELEDGTIDILIGTHALIEDKVRFKQLGLVIIDEQHRFGVAQRARLWRKGVHPPHMLVMTATPIPRTLAMTMYGDLDVSVIDELPPGRKPIKTVHRYDSGRLKVFGFMRDE